jgi:rare lipoprotein A (peptidoglycan hydrolase)
MANGRRFNPDKLTAASWFYPLGAKVQVTLASSAEPRRSVVVTITDRGPAWEYVHDGRTIDLSRASFAKLGHPRVGLLAVTVQPVNPPGANVQVPLTPNPESQRSVVVASTDRGPAWEYVRDGRTIDLSRAPFQQLDPLDLDPLAAIVQPLR